MKKFITVFFCLSMVGGFVLMAMRNRQPVEVKYEVTGGVSYSSHIGYATISYLNSTGGVAQESGTPIPWTRTFRARTGDSVHLSAQIDSGDGWVTVNIYKNGKLFKTASSTGAYVVASASGTL
jgi:hypothetical protein